MSDEVQQLREEVKQLRSWLEGKFTHIHTRFNDMAMLFGENEANIENASKLAQHAHTRLDSEINRERDHLRNKRSYSPPGNVALAQQVTTTYELGENTRKWVWGILIALGVVGTSAAGGAIGAKMQGASNAAQQETGE